MASLQKKIEDIRPYGAFGFVVTVDGEGLSCFQEVSGLSVSLNTTDRKEGGVNGTIHKLIDHASFSNVTLKRGLCATDMYSWIQDAISGDVTRREVKIELLDDAGNTVKVYTLRNAIPVKWSGPALSVTQDAIATESIEFAHEGLVVS